MCLFPESRVYSGVRGRPALLRPSASCVASSDSDVEGAVCREEMSQCYQAGGGRPFSTFLLDPPAGSPLAGQASPGKMEPPQEAPGCSPGDPTPTQGWEHISESVYIPT